MHNVIVLIRFMFSLSLVILAYHLLIYPLLLWIVSKFRKKAAKKGELLPSVTLLIPVYNEEAIIAEKIENSLSLDYPREELEIIVASDGSTDNSCRIIKGCAYKGIIFIEFPEHIGKVSLLNKAIAQAQGEVIVFSDASGMLNREALKEIVKNFCDPNIGCVCGNYHIWRGEGKTADEFEARYFDFESFVKRLESKIYTTLGGHGALYAIKKDLFTPLEKDIINDDFFISAQITLKGLRTVYEEKAHIWDKANIDARSEFRRRIRLAVGGWQQVFRLRQLFDIKRPFIAWQFFSHKFLRIITPFCFLFIILRSAFSYPLFLTIIALSFLSALFLRNMFLVFILSNLAGIAGTYKFFFKKGKVTW